RSNRGQFVIGGLTEPQPAAEPRRPARRVVSVVARQQPQLEAARQIPKKPIHSGTFRRAEPDPSRRRVIDGRPRAARAILRARCDEGPRADPDPMPVDRPYEAMARRLAQIAD